MNHNTMWSGRPDAHLRGHTGASNDGAGRLAEHIDHERIARIAYGFYESRLRGEGQADEDWFRAETEYAGKRERYLASVR